MDRTPYRTFATAPTLEIIQSTPRAFCYWQIILGRVLPRQDGLGQLAVAIYIDALNQLSAEGDSPVVRRALQSSRV